MEYINQGDHPQRNIIFTWLLTLVIMFLAILYGLPFVLDQHEKEVQWRAERLCEQGYYCNPKRGA